MSTETAAPYAVEARLGSGLRVVIRENHNNPTVSLSGILPLGRIDDPPQLPGLGSLAEELLTAGTVHYGKFQLAELLEDNAIDLGFGTGRESLSLGGRSLSADFPRLIDLLAETLLNSNFPAEEVELARQQALADLLDSMDDTRDQASMKARELAYGPGHPFNGRVSGTEEGLRAIRRADLADWHGRLCHGDGAVLSIVGDVDAQQAIELLEERLGQLSAEPQDRSALLASGGDFSALQASSGTRSVIPMPDKANATLIWIGAGPSKSSPDWTAAFIAAFIFGGDFYSRLNERLRVKEGLTYGSYSRFGGARAAGPLFVIAQVSPKNVDKAVELAQEEMTRYCAEGPSADELKLAQDFLCGNFPVSLSHNGAIAGALADAVYLGRGVDYIPNYQAMIRAVSLSDVVEAAKAYFDPKKMALTAAGTI